MFELLTQVLLWILIGYIAWFLLKQFIPEKLYTFLGFIVLVALIVLAFFEPEQGIVSEAWSILSLPFRPLGLALVLLLMNFPFKGLFQWKSLQNFTVWAVLILLVGSAPATAYWLNQQAEQETIRLVTNSTVDGSNVIVVLAQDTTKPLIPPRTQAELTETGDRLRYTAQLYAEQPGSAVIISAGSRPDVQGGDSAERRETREARQFLEGFGVPPGQIVVDDESRTIRESAVNVGKILRERFPETEKIVLVTSALQMPRAASTFTRSMQRGSDRAVRVVPRSTDFHTVQSGGRLKHRNQFPNDILPDEYALYLTSKAMKEQFVSVYYFLRGWLSSVT